jgi:hypothetical protein
MDKNDILKHVWNFISVKKLKWFLQGKAGKACGYNEQGQAAKDIKGYTVQDQEHEETLETMLWAWYGQQPNQTKNNESGFKYV